MTHVTEMIMHQTRMTSIELREIYGLDAYPILPETIPTSSDVLVGKNDVVRIVLNSLPIPDDLTPWEQILDFRNDPDSFDKFIDLRHWMSEMARAALSPIEAEEKLEYLLSRYRRHMELHRMKVKAGTIETMVVTTGELFEHLSHLEFGKLAKALFSFRHRQIELKEGELNSIGNEVAYIVKAQDTFG